MNAKHSILAGLLWFSGVSANAIGAINPSVVHLWLGVALAALGCCAILPRAIMGLRNSVLMIRSSWFYGRLRRVPVKGGPTIPPSKKGP